MKMMKKWIIPLLLLLGACVLVWLGVCTTKDPLPLWEEQAPAKKALIQYLKTVTRKNSPDFIPIENRIAVFDLDGTLMLETAPTYFDMQLFEHRVLDDARYQPTEKQRLVASAAREKHQFPALNTETESMYAASYKGMSLSEFDDFIRSFMQEEQPGFVGMRRGEAFYKPMVEVVNLLIKNKFTVYICSGTNRLVVRPLVEKNLPAIAPHQIIGSDSTIVASSQGNQDGLDYTFQPQDTLILGGKHLVKNLQMNKVSAIVREIGVQPVLAFGNSSTDASMINYTLSNNKYKALGFMLCNDDAQREYGNIQKAKAMRAKALQYGWIPISMREDWKTIYGPRVTRR